MQPLTREDPYTIIEFATDEMLKVERTTDFGKVYPMEVVVHNVFKDRVLRTRNILIKTPSTIPLQSKAFETGGMPAIVADAMAMDLEQAVATIREVIMSECLVAYDAWFVERMLKELFRRAATIFEPMRVYDLKGQVERAMPAKAERWEELTEVQHRARAAERLLQLPIGLLFDIGRQAHIDMLLVRRLLGRFQTIPHVKEGF